jgi:hypothetical protein
MYPNNITSYNYANPQSLAIGAAPTIGQQAPDYAFNAGQTLPNPYNIDMHSLINEWNLSTEYVRMYTRDFKFLDDLVDGVPLNHQNGTPFVGDMTLAGLVHSIPRDSLQQLPVLTVSINGTKNSVPALLATYLLKNTAFNEDTFGKGLLSTLQIGAEQALSHGYAPFMVATGSMFNNFGTTLKLLHYMDNAPEPGIQDHNETGFDYVVANLAPSRVRKILKAARNNPNTSWNIPALEQVLASTPIPPTYSIYESAAKRNQPGEQQGPSYQFITRYETGPDATIITMCPQQVQDVPLRVIDSKSKWGYPRVIYLVIDPAALTPFGVSRVRLASPNQNLMNLYYGNIASMLLLNSKPPILQKGRFSTPVVLKQGAVWKAIDPNASADMKNMDNGALEQFVPMAQQFASQIQTIMGRPPTAGAQSMGKTGPGVQAQQQTTDTSVNQITKILENFLRQYGLVALDTLLSEQEGVDDIIVDDETKNAINDLAPGTIGDNNKITIDWQRFYQAIEEWTVEVEVSLSQNQLNDKKRADIQDMLVVLAQNAQNIPGAAQKVEELTNMLLQDQVPLAGTLAPSAPTPGMAPAQAGPALPPNPAVGSPNQ